MEEGTIIVCYQTASVFLTAEHFVERRKRVPTELSYLRESTFVRASIEQHPRTSPGYVSRVPEKRLFQIELTVSKLFDVDGKRFNIINHTVTS